MARVRRTAARRTSRSRGSWSQFGEIRGRVAVSGLVIVMLPREKGAVRPTIMAAEFFPRAEGGGGRSLSPK